MGSTESVPDGPGRKGAAGGVSTRRSRRVARLSNLAVGVGLVLLLGGFLVAALTYRPFAVPTDSMAPTIAAGDRVIAERIDGGDVRRGDIVVFDDPIWGDVSMLKRVIGIGGDTVACCDQHGRLTVNDIAVEESYLKKDGPASTTGFEATVPHGRLFLLGDNRDTSQDSRMHLADQQGTVEASEVKARVDATAWPFGRVGFRGHEGAFGPVGPVSSPGPLRWLLAACVAGSLLILGGASVGPLADRLARRGAGAGRPHESGRDARTSLGAREKAPGSPSGPEASGRAGEPADVEPSPRTHDPVVPGERRD